MEVGKLGLHQSVGRILRVILVSALTNGLDMEDYRNFLAESFHMKQLADTRIDLVLGNNFLAVTGIRDAARHLPCREDVAIVDML